MKKIFSLLFLFAIGFPCCSAATDLVVGTISCKEWVEDRTTDTNYINKSVDQSWVMGFLSAYAETTKTNFLANVKPQSIYSWMDKYCGSQPMKKIDDGALILAHQLIQRMKSKPTTN